MKKLSDIYKELGIAFTLPIEIKDSKCKRIYYENSYGYWNKREYDSDGNETYFQNSEGYWCKKEYNSDGNETYREHSKGYWHKREYDSNGNETYYENSVGNKRGTKRSSCDGKLVTL